LFMQGRRNKEFLLDIFQIEEFIEGNDNLFRVDSGCFEWRFTMQYNRRDGILGSAGNCPDFCAIWQEKGNHQKQKRENAG